MSGNSWVRYDKWGFSVGWCPHADGYYWHVYHAKYGVRWGYEWTQNACHNAVNWVIGDMRNGVSSGTYYVRGVTETTESVPGT